MQIKQKTYLDLCDMYDFVGDQCEQNTDDCKDHCGVANGTGQCVDEVDGYHCVCEPGYTGADCQVHFISPVDYWVKF